MHAFEIPDGSVISVDTDFAFKMTLSTCPCVVVMDVITLELYFAIQVCQLHKDIEDNLLVQTILNHNNAINSQFGVRELTEVELIKIANDTQNERKRILAMGTPEVRDLGLIEAQDTKNIFTRILDVILRR